MNAEIKKLNQDAEQYAKQAEKAIIEMQKIIVGQEEILRKLMIALIADGHVLLEGVPGLAKTLMVRTLAGTMDAKFQRLQFTPDLLPADIVGTKIYEHKTGTFSTKKGPIFANFILADEINRAPPKVQSALLECMQEHQVTIQGDTFLLDRPFLVLATENPIETEGTYKLPEAQVDRFMMKLIITYPTKEEEKGIIQRYTQGKDIKTSIVFKKEDIKKMQSFVQTIYADEKIEDYVASIVDATRHPKKYGLDIHDHIDFGASPRASLFLILGGKAHALLEHRGYVLPEDIKAIAHDVLRHRILLSYEAEAEGITSDAIITKIIDKIKVP